MTLPTLYSFRRCPYAIRARLALRQAGIDVALHEVALRDKPAALLALSPKGTVPVLHLADGRVIDESLDIMRWALAQADPAGWLTAAPAEQVNALIAINDGPFKRLLDRYKYPQRHPELPQQHYRDEAVALLLNTLERSLTQRPCLLSEQPSLADMAILPFVRQFSAVDAAWFQASSLGALRTWLERMVSSALFTAVMAKP